MAYPFNDDINSTGDIWSCREYQNLALIRAAKLGTMPNTRAFCTQTQTWYIYSATTSYADNGTSVLATGDGGTTNWIGIAGQYNYYNHLVGLWDGSTSIFEDIYNFYDRDNVVTPIKIICTGAGANGYSWSPRSSGSYNATSISNMSFEYLGIPSSNDYIYFYGKWNAPIAAMPKAFTNIDFINNNTGSKTVFAVAGGTGTVTNLPIFVNSSGRNVATTTRSLCLLQPAAGSVYSIKLFSGSSLQAGYSSGVFIFGIDNSVNAASIEASCVGNCKIKGDGVFADSAAVATSSMVCNIDDSSFCTTQAHLLSTQISLLSHSVYDTYDNSYTGIQNYSGSDAVTAQDGIDTANLLLPQEIKTNNYTPTVADNGTNKVLDDLVSVTYNLPANSSVAFSVGVVLVLTQGSSGPITIVPDVGVTVLSLASTLTTIGAGSQVTLNQITTDYWSISGAIV